nr:reverse transcriptase domain-containing protein [Tanacetum cinerariifolium]
MADQRTMAQLLQAPTKGYEDAIVVPAITADNFELKHGLLTLSQNKQFFGHDNEYPHAHVRYFNKITSTLKFPSVPNTSIKLMLFPFSLEGAARIWLEKEPPRSIFTWDDLVSKFINQFFPPSKTTNLRNENTNFPLRFDESFSEAWDRFKDLLCNTPKNACRSEILVDPPPPEVITLIAEVITPETAESTGSASSTTVDQDAPSPSKSQTTPKTQPPVNPYDVEEDNHDIEVSHMAHKNMVVYQMDLKTAFLNGNLREESKYALKSLKKYGFESCDPVDTPMMDKYKLDKDKEGKVVDPSHYRGMIGTLLYLTTSRPDLEFAICMCARYQAWPTKKHLHAVKRIFRYLRGTVNQGLRYLKDSSVALIAFADADHAGCQDT